jgi:hypothetical protein
VWPGRGVQLGPWAAGFGAGRRPRPAPGLAPPPRPPPAPAAGGRGLRPRVFSAHRPSGLHGCQYMPRHLPLRLILWQSVSAIPMASFTCLFSQSDQVLCRLTLALQRKSGPRIALAAHWLYYSVDVWPRSTTRGFCGDLRGAP